MLQNLLRERLPIRDLETILETLGDWAAHTKDIAVLTEYVRNALRRTISNMYAETGDDYRPRLYCVTMDPALEDVINGYIDRSPGGTTMSIPPQVAGKIAAWVSQTAESLVAGLAASGLRGTGLGRIWILGFGVSGGYRLSAVKLSSA